MPREKVVRVSDIREVVYDEARWNILKTKRLKALKIMEVLSRFRLYSIVHGSIARGDVTEKSDIDIFIPYYIPSYIVELALESIGLKPYTKLIVQATPTHAIKAYIILDQSEETIVSFPLVKLKERELEFYKFGGQLDLEGLKKNLRVPGVDKRLILIKPTRRGHIEIPVIGRESEVASILGISVETVMERVRVLTRRDEKGRTGVFVKYELSPDESFEEALYKLINRNPLVRRQVYERGQ